MHGIKRPSNKDTEEDLLRFQQDFENRKKDDPNFQSTISAELIKVEDKDTELPMIEELIFKNNDSLPSILHRVTEISNNQLPNLPQESSLPFPKAVVIDYKSLQKSAGKGKSLFALHIEKQGRGDILGTQLHTPQVNVARDVIALESQIPNFDSLLTGEGLSGGSIDTKCEVDKIHQENINRLKSMTKEEILEEQEKLRASLDPNLLDFLQKRKRRHEISDPVCESEKNVTPLLESSNLNEDVQGLIGEAKRQKWKHFDLIESEKLEWMQTNESEMEKKGFQTPRFDFEGRLIPLGVEMPTETGLFHHGEEGDRPGYTLEELIHLSDSSLQSQKIISLQTLACIAKNAQNDNTINQVIEASLLKILIDIGIPLIFRVAMDSTTVSIMCLGILGIRNLLVNNTDCEFIETFQLTTLGISLPLIKSTLQPLKSSEQEPSELEVLQHDIVQGLIKTNILTRIKYIIEVIKPPPTSVICCIEILTHFSRYATSTAIQVVNTDKLISLILRNFLPFELTFEKELGSYGRPSVESMKLFYHLIVASKTIASILLSKERLMEILLQFALLETRNFTENKEQITQFIIYSLQTLRALACYGIGLDYFQIGYETFVNKLQYFLGKFTEIDGNESNCLTSLINYISEISLCLASSKEHSIELLNPIINIVLGISQKAVLRLETGLDINQQNILSAILHLFSTLTNKSIISKFNSPVDLISQLESFTSAQYTPLYQNKLTKQLFNSLMQTSTNSNNATQYNTFPTLLQNTGINTNYVITSNLLYNLVSFHLSISTQLTHLKLTSPYNIPGLSDVIITYLQSVVEHNKSNSTNAFFLLEIPLVYKLFILCESQLETNPEQTILCQNFLFFLISNLQPGQDFYLNTLINKYLFSPKFYGKREKPNLTNEELKSIHQTYTALLQFLNITGESIDNSQILYNRNRVNIHTLSLQSFTGPLFPIDWITMPIFVLYNKEETKPNIPSGFQTNVRFLTDCLKYYNWAESNNIHFLSTIHASTRVARIMLAFLLGDMFLTDEINHELERILQTYSRREFIQKLDFSAIQGVPNFCELYAEVCAHYNSVSFGDPTFAQFLLIPLISNPSTNIKLIIWKNCTDIFRLFPIPFHDISLPIDCLLKPYETDTKVLSAMIQMLLQGKLRHSWSPIFYLMAIHHTSHFVSTEPSDPNEKLMGSNFVIALIGAENSLFEDFVCYDEALSVSKMSFKKKDISQAKLKVNTVYKEAFDNVGSEAGRERSRYIIFN